MDEKNNRRGKWLSGILVSFGVIVGIGGYIAVPCASLPYIIFGILCIVLGIFLPKKRLLLGILIISCILCVGIEFYLLTITDLCWINPPFPTPTPTTSTSSLSSNLLDSNDAALEGVYWNHSTLDGGFLTTLNLK